MSRRNSMLIAVVAVVAAIGAYWMLVLSPKREEAVKLDGQITKQQSALATAEADVATYEAAQKHYKANYSMVARLGKAVPADDDVRSLLVQVNAAAKHAGVDFRTINISASGAPSHRPGGRGRRPTRHRLRAPRRSAPPASRRCRSRSTSRAASSSSASSSTASTSSSRSATAGWT